MTIVGFLVYLNLDRVYDSLTKSRASIIKSIMYGDSVTRTYD